MEERQLPTISWGTLHFVSKASPNLCFTEEVSKFAVIASIINKTKEYTFQGQARSLKLGRYRIDIELY